MLDTNVVVSAFRSYRGASNRLLRHVGNGTVRLLCSTSLFLEYEAVLSRAKTRRATGHSLQDVEAIMRALAAVSEPVDIRFRIRPILRDASDEMVLEAARSGGADALVTHNVRDFGPARTLGIEVATPSDVVRRLRG